MCIKIRHKTRISGPKNPPVPVLNVIPKSPDATNVNEMAFPVIFLRLHVANPEKENGLNHW
jgi:hypothetical protein